MAYQIVDLTPDAGELLLLLDAFRNRTESGTIPSLLGRKFRHRSSRHDIDIATNL